MIYSDMSDFEINCAVAGLLGEIVYSNKDGIKHKAYRIGDRYRDVYASGWSTDVFDPCNSWADAGPIIADNHIAVVPYQHTLPQAWPTAFGLVSKFTTEDKNPLRAAMIVFLMIKEG